MRKSNFKNKNTFVKKSDKDTDRLVSNCTDCTKSIFKLRDEYLWTNRGFVHQWCEDETQKTA